MLSTSRPSTAALRPGLGYVRVSRRNGRHLKGDGSYISKEVQREITLATAAKHGVKIVRWIEEEDVSGGDSTRRGYNEAIEAVESGDVQVVVVAKLNRFGRSNLDTMISIDRLEKAGGGLVAGDLDVDTSTMGGKLIRGLFAILAENEREVIKENWAIARAKAKERGVYARKPIPGYRRNEEKALEVDPAVAPLVVALFAGRGAGRSWRVLQDAWHEAGGPTLSRSGMIAMVANRTYLGEWRDGEEVVPDAHEALVTVEAFEAAQGTSVARPARRGEGALLTALLVCSGCGGRMTTGRSSRGVPLYICQAGRAHICTNRQSIYQAKVDPFVEAAFLSWANDVEVEGVAEGEEQLVAAVAALEGAEAELHAYLAATSALSDPSLFAAGAETRKARITEAREALSEIRASGTCDDVRLQVRTAWPDLGVADRRRLIRAAFDRVDVSPATHGRWTPIEERCVIVPNPAA